MAASVLRTLSARATSARERCGLLFGERQGSELVVRAVEELENRASSDGRFELDPVRTVEAARRRRLEGLELLGAWHTHPVRSTALSAHDLSGGSPGQLSIVVAADGALAAYEHTSQGGAALLELSSAGLARG